jgi:nitroreductase
MDIVEALRTRRRNRPFTPEPVPAADILAAGKPAQAGKSSRKPLSELLLEPLHGDEA